MPCAIAMALNWMNVMRGIRVAPLGLNILAGRLPRALPWADIGLARWAGTHGADMELTRWAGTHGADMDLTRWAGTHGVDMGLTCWVATQDAVKKQTLWAGTRWKELR